MSNRTTRLGWVGLLILVVAFVIRVVSLDTVPATLNRDEAALAYNALLLNETGRDEWQRSWPLTLESFGDYKLPGYVWALVPLFRVFGYHDWVVRLPAALAGVAIVWLVFRLGEKLGLGRPYAWLAMLAAALAPGLIFYSRMAWEANLGLALFLWGVDWLWPRTNDNQLRWWQVLLIGGIWLLASFTYNTPWLLLPMVIVLVPWWWGWRRWRRWAGVVLALVVVWVVGVAVLVPVTQRKSGITLFSDETTGAAAIAYRLSLPPAWQSTLGHRYVFLAGQIAARWMASWGPEFVVFQGGGHPWHQLPGYAHLAAPVYLLGLLGVGLLLIETIRQLWRWRWPRVNRLRTSWLILMLVGFLPAAITVDAPHATRSLVMWPWWCLAAAGGWQWLVGWLQQRGHKMVSENWALIGAMVVLVGFGGRYCWDYFTKYPQQSAAILRAGYSQALTKVANLDAVAVVDEDGYQYIVTAWVQKIPPATYFLTTVRQLPTPIGLRYGQQVDTYHFIASPTDRVAAEQALVRWDSVSNRWLVEYQPGVPSP